ncbi:hypothetical protein GCM10009857_02120 [Agromyces soli]
MRQSSATSAGTRPAKAAIVSSEMGATGSKLRNLVMRAFLCSARTGAARGMPRGACRGENARGRSPPEVYRG